jgi:NAD(P)-dependent dehydrogenase (short-subunit alcohol dehydrogenase family)
MQKSLHRGGTGDSLRIGRHELAVRHGPSFASSTPKPRTPLSGASLPRRLPLARLPTRLDRGNEIDLRAIELDVQSQESVDRAVTKIISAHGHIDVVVHNAGHMDFGPAEAFTPEQLAELYDINVLSTQRVNRAALPHMRKQRSGLLVWVSSSSVAGGTPPYLSPYFAAKAGMDAIAVSYACELALWGIETSIVVPGAFTGGTNHFAHAGQPADTARAAEYNAGPYANYANKIMEAFAAIVPADADAAMVGDAIAKIIDMPFGKRPFRVHIDPTHDSAEVSFALIDRMGTEMLHRVGLDELLIPVKITPERPAK